MSKFIRYLFVFLLFASALCAQKPKSTSVKSGYARTNEYWGPGTFYSFAPGKPNNTTAVNMLTKLRYLTGISQEDLNTELSKQGFTEIPKNEMKKWFNETNNKDNKMYFSANKEHVLFPYVKSMYRSAKNGVMPYACNAVMRYQLYQPQDSLKVLEVLWQYLRDLDQTKILLSSFGTTFKKAEQKVYPIQKAGSTGWTSMRAGSFALINEGGKLKGYWETNEAIVRRTIGKPEFKLEALGMETDFWYTLTVKLTKEGYVVSHYVLATTMGDLEPGNNWTKEHQSLVLQYTGGMKMDKDAVEQYKKAPLPPVLLTMDKLLHR